MNEEAITRLIRRRLAHGLLPPAADHGTWAGGCMAARLCTACGHWITTGQMEIEVECVDGLKRHYHGFCHQVLESARIPLIEQEAGGGGLVRRAA